MRKNRTDPDRVRIRFNRKKLYISVSFFTLSVILICTLNSLPAASRYPRQMLGFGAIVAFICGMVFLAKLFTVEIRHELYRRIGRIFSSVSLRVQAIVDRVFEKLGIERASRRSGRDERSIVFDDSTGTKVRRRREKPKKYGDLTSNRERLRFIWAKYITDRKTKKNTPAVYDTPIEMMRRFSDLTGEDEQFLYTGYLASRYTDEQVEIPPETVQRNYRFVVGEKRI